MLIPKSFGAIGKYETKPDAVWAMIPGPLILKCHSSHRGRIPRKTELSQKFNLNETDGKENVTLALTAAFALRYFT